jgi:bifunctional non-homologous end joining protein LigD
MLASTRPLPTQGAVFEFKWDGARMAARRRADGAVRLDSRNGKAFAETFPEVSEALSEILPGRRVHLDGEVVAAHPATGAPDFARLQRRLGVTPRPPLLAGVPVKYLVFDVLEIDGTPTVGLPYLERRRLLAELEIEHRALAVPEHHLDVDPVRLLELAAAYDIEGIIGKRAESTYRTGRSTAWVKAVLRKRIEVVVGAWLPAGHGQGLGALLLGRPSPRQTGTRLRLDYLGSVGTGWSDAAGRELAGQLAALARDTSPFGGPVPPEYARHALWVEPRLVADVEYRTWTAAGMLRHPSYRGLRWDVSARELIPEG